MTQAATGTAAANAQALRRGYEAFQSGNMDLLRDELFASDIVWHSPGRNVLSGDFRGPDAVIQSFIRNFEETNGTFRVEVHDILASDQHAVALAHVHAERNGKSIDEPYAHVCHFRDGKISEAWIADYDLYAVDDLFS